MKLFRWLMSLLGISAATTAIGASAAQKVEHAVVVHFAYGSKDLSRLFVLEKKLESAITKAGVGEYDGNEVVIDGSDGYLYMYGPDADLLFRVVEPILKATPFMAGAKAKRRYGPPEAGVKESIVEIIP